MKYMGVSFRYSLMIRSTLNDIKESQAFCRKSTTDKLRKENVAMSLK